MRCLVRQYLVRQVPVFRSSCPATGTAAVPTIRVTTATTGLVRRTIVTTRTT
ncbi:hypothetical protein J6D24_00850 [Candidatus Saccharibacteria bacterium]|nr:hypothetical protein [Candidatus Saccharibacteria bacterium]